MKVKLSCYLIASENVLYTCIFKISLLLYFGLGERKKKAYKDLLE